MAESMPVITLDPTSDARWLALQGAPGFGLFHSPAWMQALRDAYGFIPRAHVVVDAQGMPRGGIPFCEIHDAFGSRLASLPFSDVCDPVLLDPDAWSLLLEKLAEHRWPVTIRCLVDAFPGSDSTFVVTKRARWHTLQLSGPADAIRNRFGDATRRAIAKAERAGLTLRPLAGDDGLAAFVGLHVRLRKQKYRMLAQPPAFFASIADRFRAAGNWHPVGAYLGDQLLAATIYLRWGDTLYYKFNASDPDGLAWRPNNLLVWGGVQLAQSLGCGALDLGPSDDTQPGLIRFKREFGAIERELRFIKWTPPGCVPETGAPFRNMLGEITQLLTAPNVPDEVTAAAGARLYRYFA